MKFRIEVYAWRPHGGSAIVEYRVSSALELLDCLMRNRNRDRIYECDMIPCDMRTHNDDCVCLVSIIQITQPADPDWLAATAFSKAERHLGDPMWDLDALTKERTRRTT